MPRCFSCRRSPRQNGRGGCQSSRSCTERISSRRTAFPTARSGASTPGSTVASGTTLSRSASTTGTGSTGSGWSRGTPTGCWTPIATARCRTGLRSSARWSGGSSAHTDTSRRDCSRRCGASAPASCSRTSSLRARSRSSPPRVVSGCPSSHTSRAGTTRSERASSRPTASSTSSRTRVMEDDLGRYHGIEPERVRVTGWPQTDLFARHRPRADYEGLLRGYGLDPSRPLVLVAGNTPSNAPYEGRFVERIVAWWEERGGLRGLPAAAPASPARRPVAGALRRGGRSGGCRRPGGQLHRPPGARDPPPARRRRRLQRGHDPPRRARGRPAGRVRALRRGRAAR